MINKQKIDHYNTGSADNDDMFGSLSKTKERDSRETFFHVNSQSKPERSSSYRQDDEASPKVLKSENPYNAYKIKELVKHYAVVPRESLDEGKSHLHALFQPISSPLTKAFVYDKKIRALLITYCPPEIKYLVDTEDYLQLLHGSPTKQKKRQELTRLYQNSLTDVNVKIALSGPLAKTAEHSELILSDRDPKQTSPYGHKEYATGTYSTADYVDSVRILVPEEIDDRNFHRVKEALMTLLGGLQDVAAISLRSLVRFKCFSNCLLHAFGRGAKYIFDRRFVVDWLLSKMHITGKSNIKIVWKGHLQIKMTSNALRESRNPER